MSKALPPLTALRALEAAGRHLSFVRAAAELHVTPAAVSHQIKALEAFLGVPLFRRGTRRVYLTDPAQAALPHLREGFAALRRAVDAVRDRRAEGVLTLSTSPSFAAKWLMPRLARFAARCPEIELRLAASTALVDFTREDVDAAIRFGRGHYPGLRADRLFGETLAPLLSPTLLRGRAAPRTPADLLRLPLLHDDSIRTVGTQPGWLDWFRAAGVRLDAAPQGLHVDDGHLALQAAVAGRGVVLGRLVLAADELASGALVAPFPPALTLDLGYFLVAPESRAGQPMLEALRAWVLEEAEAFARTLPAAAPSARRRRRR